MKLASAIYNGAYPFIDTGLFTSSKGVTLPDDLTKDYDALVVWGGEDISPALYNHKRSSLGYGGLVPSRRDTIEWELMKQAVSLGMPIIGICRGAQMLCALAGGSLYQHVDHHTRTHKATCNDGTELVISSVHHQMMNPEQVDHEMVMWSTEILSNRHIVQDDSNATVTVEPEFIYFPDVRGHAIQWHPEFMDSDCEANKWLTSHLQKTL